MKMHVDEDLCMGHGRCYGLAPDLLESDDEGYVTLRGDVIELPQDCRELAQDLVGSCPEGAIRLLEE